MRKVNSAAGDLRSISGKNGGPGPMGARRHIANFFIKGCRLRKLQDGKLQRFIRTVLDEIDLQHVRDAYPCSSFSDRAEMFRHVQESYIKGEALDYLEFGVFQGESIRQWAR